MRLGLTVSTTYTLHSPAQGDRRDPPSYVIEIYSTFIATFLLVTALAVPEPRFLGEVESLTISEGRSIFGDTSSTAKSLRSDISSTASDVRSDIEKVADSTIGG